MDNLTSTSPTFLMIKKLLKELKVKIPNSVLKIHIKNHPISDTLYGMSDILKNFSIDTLLIELSLKEFDRIQEISFPFISLVKERDVTQYILVQKVEKNIIHYQNTKETITEALDKFFQHWTGFVLLAFPNEKAGERIFSTKKRQIGFKKTAFRLMSIGLAFSTIGYLIILFQSNLGLQGVLLMILKLIGLGLCSLLILNDFNNKNSIVNRVCSASKSDCNKILSNNNAKLFGIINWSELGLIYFGGSLLFLFFSIEKLTYAIHILGFLNFSCVLFSFYSIWFQAFKAKEWCYFCLATLVVFWLEFTLLFPIFSWVLPANWQVYIIALLSFSGMITLTFFITLFFNKVNKLNDVKLELNFIKYDSALFNQLLESEKSYNTEGGIALNILGNEETTNSIVVITNPLCKPCFRTHNQLTDYLIGCYDNYQISFIFKIRDYSDTNSEDYKVVKRIMALYQYKGQEAALQAMENWYDNDNQNTYTNWEIFHPVENEDVDDLILLQKEWCEKNTILVTPTVIVNQKQLPKYYQVSDLKYFLD